MKTPFYTGQAASLLQTTEPRLGELVRQKRIDPAPPVFFGRRLWDVEHLLQAADALGVLTDELRKTLGVDDSPQTRR